MLGRKPPDVRHVEEMTWTVARYRMAQSRG
jgi:hypothetical protein